MPQGFTPPTGPSQSKSKGSKDNPNDSSMSLKTIKGEAADSNASLKVQAGSKAVSVKSGHAGGQNTAKK